MGGESTVSCPTYMLGKYIFSEKCTWDKKQGVTKIKASKCVYIYEPIAKYV